MNTSPGNDLTFTSQPNEPAGDPPTVDRKKPVGLTHLAHRQTIGWLGITLPILVLVISRLWPVPAGWRMLDSISGFYYTSATGVFVGTLFALALFLFTYGGYEGDKADRVLGKIAGTAALGVAFFPTTAPPGFTAPIWWAGWMGNAHYLAAVSLFLSFIAFSVWIFRRSGGTPKTGWSRGKRWRNSVFLVCGGIMTVGVVWAAIASTNGQPIFWPEALALAAFAVSWLVKGRAHSPVFAVATKLRSRR